jgi:hypothetical protein
MFRQQRSLYLPLAGIALLYLLTSLSLMIWRRFFKTRSKTKITKHTVETSPDQSLAHWTEKRMHEAQAMPLPETNNIRPVEGQPQRPGTAE